MRRIALFLAVIIATSGWVSAQVKPYPKPQIASATGSLAPKFTLQDQNGKDFTLASGHWVLLYFYRGYW